MSYAKLTSVQSHVNKERTRSTLRRFNLRVVNSYYDNRRTSKLKRLFPYGRETSQPSVFNHSIRASTNAEHFSQHQGSVNWPNSLFVGENSRFFTASRTRIMRSIRREDLHVWIEPP